MKNLIECPAERAIYFLGGKWKIRILFSLYNNKKVRFNELKKVLKTIRMIAINTKPISEFLSYCFIFVKFLYFLNRMVCFYPAVSNYLKHKMHKTRLVAFPTFEIF